VKGIVIFNEFLINLRKVGFGNIMYKYKWYRLVSITLAMSLLLGGLLAYYSLPQTVFAAMPITSNGTNTSAQTTGATSLTWSHTVASGTNRALFVELVIDGLGASVTSLKYGGVDLTQVGRATGNHAVEIWCLLSPAVGTANVVVSFGTTTTPAAGGATTFNGVDQMAPTGTFAGASGTSTTASVTATSMNGNLVIDVTNWDNNPVGFTIGSGQTQEWTQTSAVERGVSTTKAGATSVTMSSTVSASNQWEIGAVSIKAAVNSAPVLDNSKNPALTAQNEDCGVPSGAVGTLISALVDFAIPSGQVDNVTDVDSGAFLGIAVTVADTANGSWVCSTNGGANWNALGSVANNNARLLAADANTRIYFQPNANYNGTLTTAITFRAWDRTSGSNGSLVDTTTNGGTTAYSTANDTASLTINAVNDAPVVNNVGIYQTDHITTVTSMTPQIEYTVKVTVSDYDTLNDLSTLKVTIFYDIDGAYAPGDVPGSGNTQTAAILTRTVSGTPSWSVSPGSSSTWSILSGNCVQPDLSGTSGDFWFHFKAGKVATATSGSAKWHIYAKATDQVSATGDNYQANRTMNWYGELTLNTPSVAWSSVTPGSGFGAGVNTQTGVSVTCIANGNYKTQVMSSSSWTGTGSNANFDNSGNCSSPNQFSLQANAINGFPGIQVTTSSADIDLSGVQTTETGVTVSTNTLWLKAAQVFRNSTYSGTITYTIASR
jgi:hypothetical protein